ncbi:rhodanese-like domain-containing protein [Stakelama sediminis]|uniref:Rhodanese-related sulfurtransferase n=1 Tax=Stakelama sediminis TaxID=463200 RepID=A0A840YY88_9SPHN|nr:rhodanese-like domain-containing protein [Stakelama sediminis]MBB5718613.1 rhodanese-related sulfurtransferase [Stakelama sediminis]
MFGFGKKHDFNELSPAELKDMLDAKGALVVDVREPDEFAGGHIPGAVNMPLSRFDPSRLPDGKGKTLVLSCAGGRRSAHALGRCEQAQVAVKTHLASGFSGWVRAGMPVER